MGFTSSLDGRAKIVTRIAVLLLVALALFLYFASQAGLWLALPVAGLAAAWYMVLLKRPCGYSFVQGALLVRAPLTKRRIPFHHIGSATLLEGDSLEKVLNRSYTLGFLGYPGKLQHQKLGEVNSCATRRDQAVVLQLLNGENILLTPDNAAQFIMLLALVSKGSIAS